jgi:hypothetical protein
MEYRTSRLLLQKRNRWLFSPYLLPLISTPGTNQLASLGGFHTKEDVQKECQQIEKELAEMKKKAEFPLEILPLMAVILLPKLNKRAMP